MAWSRLRREHRATAGGARRRGSAGRHGGDFHERQRRHQQALQGRAARQQGLALGGRRAGAVLCALAGHFPAGAKSDAWRAISIFFRRSASWPARPAGNEHRRQEHPADAAEGRRREPARLRVPYLGPASASMKSNWSISDGKYKLVRNELFDLENDPGETTRYCRGAIRRSPRICGRDSSTGSTT